MPGVVVEEEIEDDKDDKEPVDEGGGGVGGGEEEEEGMEEGEASWLYHPIPNPSPFKLPSCRNKDLELCLTIECAGQTIKSDNVTGRWALT